MSETLLCFGGPADGKVVAVERPEAGLLIPVFTQAPYIADTIPAPTTPIAEIYRYRGERFFIHLDDRHIAPNPDYHTDECMHTMWALVGDYPTEQIAAAVTLIDALARWGRTLWWSRESKIWRPAWLDSSRCVQCGTGRADCRQFVVYETQCCEVCDHRPKP